MIVDENTMKYFIEKMTNPLSNITTAMSDHLQYEITFVFVIRIKKIFF